jgi:MFS family permease
LSDALRILSARGVRAFADGFVALLLPVYLVGLGFIAFAIGAIAASTLVGSALLTLWVRMIANRDSRRRLLFAVALLMAATGVGFAVIAGFRPLMIVAFIGTINPTSGDASVFLPLEQTALAQTIDQHRRTKVFAHYSLVGSLAGALGVLAAALPDLIAHQTGRGKPVAIRLMFIAYGVLGLVSLLLYHPLAPAIEAAPRRAQARRAG